MSRSEYLALFDGVEVLPVTFGEVVYAYRIWAGYYLPDERLEREAKQTWYRFVLFNRQRDMKHAA